MPGRANQRKQPLPQQGAVGPNVIVYTRRDSSRPIATTLGLAQRRTKGGVLTACRADASNRPGPGGEQTALLKS